MGSHRVGHDRSDLAAAAAHLQAECHMNVKMAIYKSRGEAGIDVFLTTLIGNQSCRCLDFELPNYRTARQYVSVI